MEFDFYFCETAAEMAEWLNRLELDGARIQYHSPVDEAEQGDISRHQVVRDSSGHLAVKTTKLYESAAPKFVIITR